MENGPSEAGDLGKKGAKRSPRKPGELERATSARSTCLLLFGVYLVHSINYM